MRIQAARELLAPPEDVWAFVTEPHHLRDWWPGLAAVEPDRRGLATGARWRLVAASSPTLLRKPNASGTLLVKATDPSRCFAFELPGERIGVDVTLEPVGNRTLCGIAVEGPLLFGPRRSLPQRALNRLYALCQTAAEQ